ncbi:MAG: hypothetical protein JST00_17150 [Deltaproteobacteria bacterium]|nr:hypothetical protein [Deltaproteobacteria bacterium]
MLARLRLGRLVLPCVSFAVPVLAAALGNACDLPDVPPFTPTTGVQVRFRTAEALPQYLDVPFPSDLYLQGGRFSSAIPFDKTFKFNGNLIAKQLASLDGWSRIAPVLFAIEDASKPALDNGESPGAGVDRAKLPVDEDACKADGSSIFLVDLDATDKASARVPCRAVVLDERELESSRFLLGVGPARGIVLEEGHHYAAVLTSRLVTEDGKPIARSKDFAAIATKSSTDGAAKVYAPAYDKVMSVLGDALAADKAEILALSPYTVQKNVDELYALREVIESAPAPTLAWDAPSVAPMTNARFSAKTEPGFTATLDAWLGTVAPSAKLPDGQDDPDESLPVRAHDKIGAIGTAVFNAKSFLRTRPGKFDDPSLEHATFEKDASGKFVEQAPVKVWMTIAVPSSPMPAGGYPAVIVQHGLSGSRAYLLATANRFASKGWVAVAIDSVTFGARATDPKFQVDGTTDYVDAPGVTYKGGDGISDIVKGERAGSFDLFGGLKNLLALRDQLRQAELDTTQVVKVLRSNPDLSPLAIGGVTPKIDPERIAYVGDSLGGIQGAVAAAIEPRLKAWTLNVAGGGFVYECAAHGPVTNANLPLAGTANFGFGRTMYSEGHPVVVIAQTLAEAGDPIAYASRLVKSPAPLAGAPTTPRNILQIEVLYDELVANECNEALARAAGYGMASPNVGPNAGVADLATRATYPGGGIKLDILPAAPDGYRDVPKPGVTAVLVQVSPGHHGADLVRSKGGRSYRIPYNKPDGKLDLSLQSRVDVPCPYRALQETMVRFFGDAFDGKVPVVTGIAAPVRDADGDGRTDDGDSSPVGP